MSPAVVIVRPPAALPVRTTHRLRAFWRSVVEELVRFLLFVLGPADIGPLPPCPLPTATHLPTAAGRGRVGGGAVDSLRQITVIPVP